MSDQAQGLRALADQTRRDPIIPVGSPTAHAATSAGPALRTPALFPNNELSVPLDMSSPGERSLEETRSDPQHAARNASLLSSPLPFTDRISGASSHSQSSAPARAARIIAVTSGKGGVGKTNFSTNLALTLARGEQRVIVMDADLGLANLHVILGMAPPFHLEHVLRREKTLREILCEGPEGIQILCGGSGITELANLDEADRDSFIAGVRDLDSLADLIVIDTGAGLSRNVMAFLCAVDEIIVVTTPEPTAITDAYAMIKVVSQENPQARLMLVVNMVQSEEEAAAVAERLIKITRQFLKIELDWIGHVPHDAAVSRAVRTQQPFVLAYPQCQATRSVQRIAEQLGYRVPSPTQSSGVGGLLTRMQRYFGLHASRA